eukprot:6457128-Amphidinium_carterae.1
MGGELSLRQVYHKLYTSDVLTGVHHFREPDWRTHELVEPITRETTWPNDIFQPPMSGGDAFLRDIMAKRATWHSPTPSTAAKVYAEMYLMVLGSRKNNWAAIEENVNYGMLLRKPVLLVREIGKEWLFCLGEAASNVLLVWPAEEVHEVRGCKAFLPSCGEKAQCKLELPGKLVGDRRQTHLLAVVTEKPAKLLYAAAHQCFFDVDLHGLSWLCKKLGVEVTGSGVVEHLMALVTHVVPDITSDEMAGILAQRLAVQDGLDALLESESIQECMHDADVPDFEQAEKQRKNTRSRESEYRHDYVR